MSFTIGKEISVARVQRAERSAREAGEKFFFFFTENRNFGQNRKLAE